MKSRHPASTAALIMGLLFGTLGVTGVVNAYLPLSLSTVGIIFASAFTIAGLIGFIGALRRPASDDVEAP